MILCLVIKTPINLKRWELLDNVTSMHQQEIPNQKWTCVETEGVGDQSGPSVSIDCGHCCGV